MKIEDKNISNEDFIKCPYCGKEFKFVLHTNHLKIHNKNLKDLLIEFPDVMIITRKYYDDTKIKRLEGKRKKDKETKKVNCYYCKELFIVNVNVSNNYSVCNDCKAKNLKCPIKRKYKKPSKENLEIGIKKRKITNQKIYGGNAPACDSNVREKMYKKNLKLFGVKHALQNKDILKKFEETNLRIYQNKCSLLNEDVKQKTEITSIKNWGEDHWTKSEKGKQILREKGLERHLDRIMNKAKILNLLLQDSEYQNASYHHNWLCLKCDKILKTSWNNIQQGYKCPTCYPR